MITRVNTKGLFLAGVLIFAGITSYSQNTDCKVIMPSIAGKYSGECRKGLANGQGISEGVDRYSGTFKNGLPNGTGTYTWADGSEYEGRWSNGMRDGAGQMVTADSAYSGIWKEDKYMGKIMMPAYKIDRSYNIVKSSFFKSKSTNEGIRIRFYQGATEGGGLKSVNVAYSSGEQFRDGNIYGIQHPSFPIEIRLTFIAESMFGMSEFEANLDFTINEPGAWDVKISY